MRFTVLALLAVFSLMAPSVLAENNVLLQATFTNDAIANENILQFFDHDGKMRQVMITERTSQRCRVVVGSAYEWLEKGKSVLVGGVRVVLTDVGEYGCQIVITPPNEPYINENEVKPAITISSIKLDNIKQYQPGYAYVKEGQPVSFTVSLYNPGDKAIKTVPFIFYNNGYPTGEGATKKKTSVVTLPPKKEVMVRFTMDFLYEEDKMHNSGLFNTAFVLDPDEMKVRTTVAGTTIYLAPRSATYICGDDICQFAESTTNCPSDCSNQYSIGGYLEEGQQQEFSLLTKKYTVTALLIEEAPDAKSEDFAAFRVKGVNQKGKTVVEETVTVPLYEQTTLDDGSVIVVERIGYTGKLLKEGKFLDEPDKDLVIFTLICSEDCQDEQSVSTDTSSITVETNELGLMRRVLRWFDRMFS